MDAKLKNQKEVKKLLDSLKKNKTFELKVGGIAWQKIKKATNAIVQSHEGVAYLTFGNIRIWKSSANPGDFIIQDDLKVSQIKEGPVDEAVE